MSMSLFLRNLFFTILQPGVVAGLIPYLLARQDLRNAFSQPLHFYEYTGIAIFVAGLLITLHCIINFGINGRGTLSPADPTKRLVVSGLYKFSRNPMYVGVMLMLTGETVFAWSDDIFVYSAGTFLAFNLFIIFREEPRLKRDFGAEYDEYKKAVRRWI